MTTTTTKVANPQAQVAQQDDQVKTKRTECEVWTRVMGYHRPTRNFNIGKKSEHYSRKHFQEAGTMNSKFCACYS